MATYRDLARERYHLRALLEFLPCRMCATSFPPDPARKLCAYDFALDAWFCSEEHLAEWRNRRTGVNSAARGDHAEVS